MHVTIRDTPSSRDKKPLCPQQPNVWLQPSQVEGSRGGHTNHSHLSGEISPRINCKDYTGLRYIYICGIGAYTIVFISSDLCNGLSIGRYAKLRVLFNKSVIEPTNYMHSVLHLKVYIRTFFARSIFLLILVTIWPCFRQAAGLQFSGCEMVSNQSFSTSVS